eukprot:7070144-Prorocentrum_lima.AAC.1
MWGGVFVLKEYRALLSRLEPRELVPLGVATGILQALLLQPACKRAVPDLPREGAGKSIT